jgi:hypothetical protein
MKLAESNVQKKVLLEYKIIKMLYRLHNMPIFYTFLALVDELQVIDARSNFLIYVMFK